MDSREFEAICSLSRLQQLRLCRGGDSLSSGVQSITHDISRLSRLESLTIHSTSGPRLTALGVPVSDALSRLACLTALNLNGTRDCFVLACNMPSITRLSLRNVSEAVQVPAALSCLCGIRELSLNYCSVAGDMHGLSALTALQSLTCHNLRVAEGGSRMALCSALGQLTKLSYLMLGSCDIGL